MNLSHLFEIDKTFFSRRNLKIFFRDVRKKNNIDIAVISSKGREGNDLGNTVLDVNNPYITVKIKIMKM